MSAAGPSPHPQASTPAPRQGVVRWFHTSSLFYNDGPSVGSLKAFVPYVPHRDPAVEAMDNFPMDVVKTFLGRIASLKRGLDMLQEERSAHVTSSSSENSRLPRTVKRKPPSLDPDENEDVPSPKRYHAALSIYHKRKIVYFLLSVFYLF